MSPATNTPGTEVSYDADRATLPRGVELDAQVVEQARLLRAGEAHREQRQVARDLPAGARHRGEPAAVEGHLGQPQRPHRAVRRRRRTPRWRRRRPGRRPPRARRRPGRSSGRSATAGSSARALGGFGMISSWVTEAAPCRCEVPRQSAPVSPPPMITTCLPAALTGESAPCRLAGGRNSIAWWMPASVAAGHRQVAGHPRAAGEHDRGEARRAAPPSRPARRRRTWSPPPPSARAGGPGAAFPS